MHKSQQLNIKDRSQSQPLQDTLVQSQIIKIQGRKSLIFKDQQQLIESINESHTVDDNCYIPFQQRYPLAKREKWMTEALIQFPNKIPIIMETTTYKQVRTYFQYFTSFIHESPLQEMQQIQNPKFLVPNNFEIRNLTAILKEKLTIDKKENIILFANNIVLKPDRLLKDVYQKHKDIDGFLYIKYMKEDTFGS